MKDIDLVEIAGEFRRGILGRRKSAGMCAAVCWALQSYLSVIHNLALEAVEGGVEIEGVAWCNHVWLRLSDGRVLDPTIDQFSDMLGTDPSMTVYLGEPLPLVHR